MPTTMQQWTAICLGLLLLLVGAVDVFLIYMYGESESITAVVKEYSHKYPWIPLVTGMLIGHLFL